MTIQPTLPLTRELAATSRKPSRVRRALLGGHLSDLGRLPRYLAFAVLGSTLIWVPIIGYLKTAPLSYKSSASLILPGSGASASMNLNGIGQSSSYANSAFASNAVSPTETYKRLLNADRILQGAAIKLNINRTELGRPRINLVDQTSLIHIEMTGSSPEDAKQKGEAIMYAFFSELDALRADEVSTRQDSGSQAIEDYRASVNKTQSAIAQLQTESGLFSVDQYDILLNRNLALQENILKQAADLSQNHASVTALAKQLDISPKNAAATLKLFADGSYLAMLEEIAKLEATFAIVSAQYGFSHPKVEEARNAKNNASSAAIQIAQTITGLEANNLASLDLAPQGVRADLLAQLVRMKIQFDGASTQLQTLQNQLDEGNKQLVTLSAAAAQLQGLERDFSVAEAVFASAIAKSQSSKSDVYASYPLVQILENPSLAEKPSSPNQKLAIAAGAAATIMLLISLIMGWVRLALINRLLTKPENA
jgi:uncharacterized protein involved in exopolysaccharide biosynthesis